MNLRNRIALDQIAAPAHRHGAITIATSVGATLVTRAVVAIPAFSAGGSASASSADSWPAMTDQHCNYRHGKFGHRKYRHRAEHDRFLRRRDTCLLIVHCKKPAANIRRQIWRLRSLIIQTKCGTFAADRPLARGP
jgi:hypothetical protein